MNYEKGLRYKTAILGRYHINIKKYRLNGQVREFYSYKICENKKTLDAYEEIISFIGNRDIDRDRFYYIYWEMAECLYHEKRYGEACEYFKIAIDNVIGKSYRKNVSKLKSGHYALFLKDYFMAVDCFIRAGRFDDADYYDNLNMYYKNYSKLSDEYMGDMYASLGAKNQAIKYYEKRRREVNIHITREYHPDPYTDDAYKEIYEREIAKRNERVNEIDRKINSL